MEWAGEGQDQGMVLTVVEERKSLNHIQQIGRRGNQALQRPVSSTAWFFAGLRLLVNPKETDVWLEGAISKSVV